MPGEILERLEKIAEHLEKICAEIGMRNSFIAVAVLFVAFFYVISRVFGWHDLTKHYPGRNPYQGEWISHPEVEGQQGGLIVYFNHGVSEDAIKLGADREGLYIEASLAYRLFHPPLFVPWSDVTSSAVKEVPWLKKANLVRFTFAMRPDLPLEVDSYVAREVEKRAEGRWTMPELESK
jgi:hypothetical protein